ncbi:basic-leucine zipper transcription factor f-related [Anaeramoeba ignava]|uniref:Basic-leucine zipper transcription factor f-related n=1 Tax=Anaeramoeba ignava TaxID=1746090 RepID=A0A9Q0R7C9_ANAIG|nr:basic-leucine zipper transcription factor f-related [Anaeramoeba ignava]
MAAKNFRQRQREQIQELEKKLEELEKTNRDYRTRTDALEAEKNILVSQLQYFQNFMTRAMTTAYRNSPPVQKPDANPNKQN